jgi:Iron-containing redox enzyme
VIPRLGGKAKAALIEIQGDEYGAGQAEAMHAVLFRNTMRALGLDDSYGGCVGRLPGVTLAGVNLMSFFGLHRRWRGAIVGHLALFEMTSTEPNRRYGNALRKLGFGRDATHFYDEHVEADAVHEAIAAHDLAGSLAQEEPNIASDIEFGARCLQHLDELWCNHVIEAWEHGRSSLL